VIYAVYHVPWLAVARQWPTHPQWLSFELVKSFRTVAASRFKLLASIYCAWNAWTVLY
jgi:hypothetical protein